MSAIREIHVPDIGDFTEVEIIEVSVAPGDQVNEEGPLITLETDKASMEVPSPASGQAVELKVQTGARVSQGAVILTLEAGEAAAPVEPPSPEGHQESYAAPIEKPAPAAPEPAPKTDPSSIHASPSVRRLARELEVDLAGIQGSGEKGRITKDDIKAAGTAASSPATAAGGIPEIPAVDFSKFRRSRSSRFRGSRRFPGRICTAPGSTSRRLPTATRRTSPGRTATGRNWTPPPRKRVAG